MNIRNVYFPLTQSCMDDICWSARQWASGSFRNYGWLLPSGNTGKKIKATCDWVSRKRKGKLIQTTDQNEVIFKSYKNRQGFKLTIRRYSLSTDTGAEMDSAIGISHYCNLSNVIFICSLIINWIFHYRCDFWIFMGVCSFPSFVFPCLSVELNVLQDWRDWSHFFNQCAFLTLLWASVPNKM